MSEAERVYSARQAAEQLGLSIAMTRRYAAALEEVTGEPIRQHPRDGRQYREDQLAAMVQAKAYVEANPRLTVSDALRLALGIITEGVAPELSEGPQIGSQALSAAFVQALEQTLLPEIRELRAEVAGLRAESRERAALPESEPITASDRESSEHADGPLVRLARRLEEIFRVNKS